MALINSIGYFAVINIVIVLLGYLFIHKKQLLLSWFMLIMSITAVYLLFKDTYPIIRMFTIIATTFTGVKVIAVIQSYSNKPLTLKFYQWVAFSLGWAGMRAEPFETLGSVPLPNAWAMVRFGASRVLIGIVFILTAHCAIQLPLNQHLVYFIVTALLLVGLSFVLHFGMLSISAGMWRFSGVDTYYLFRQPARSLSISEFWGKRWNIAFIEMTSIIIFRPLKNKIGNGWALMAAFGFSGLLHELVISVPVNSGYGLPTVYFLIQGGVVLVEKYLDSKDILLLKHTIAARLWVFFWLVIPMPLLFPPQFIKEIVWGLMP